MESCNTTEEEDMKGRKGTLSTFHVICMSFLFSLAQLDNLIVSPQVDIRLLFIYIDIYKRIFPIEYFNSKGERQERTR